MTPECAEIIRKIISEAGYLTIREPVWTELHTYYTTEECDWRDQFLPDWQGETCMCYADCTFYMFVLLSEGYEIL